MIKTSNIMNENENPQEINLINKQSLLQVPASQTNRAKDLWKKASIKILTLVRINNFNKFINNVYYGIGVEEEMLEDDNEEHASFVI